VEEDGPFRQTSGKISTVPAAAGLWTTAADLARFGAGWSSLLPAALAGEALRPHAGPGNPSVRTGFGWVINESLGVAGHADSGPAGSASLVMELDSNQVHVAMTNRRIPIEPVNGRVIRAMADAEDSRTLASPAPASRSALLSPNGHGGTRGRGWGFLVAGTAVCGLPGSGGPLGGLGGGRAVAAEDLPAGAVDPDLAAGQEFDLPAPAVDADVMVVLALCRMQSLTLVGPPSFLCRIWCTSQAAGRLSQPPGQAQCLSRRMTARRIASGMVAE
jgi:hypothetical protein